MKIKIVDKDFVLEDMLSQYHVEFVEDNSYDFIFVNVDKAGIDTLENYDPNHTVLILESVNGLLNIIHQYPYLLTKPYEEKYMSQLMKKLITLSDSSITISNRTETMTIPFDDIVLVASSKRVLEVYGKNGIIIKYYDKLNNVEDRFPASFIRIHQSYLINKNYIININRKWITLEGIDVTLPISRNHMDEVKELLKL